MIEHQTANYKLCFLSEERLFSLIVDLNKNILVEFITHRENKTKLRNNHVLFPGL